MSASASILSATPRSRRERQAATRAALLRSASRSICKHGMDGASVERIARAAGFTKGAFYANFASKEELFLVMLDEKFANEIERLDRALAGVAEPGDEARRAARDFLANVDQDSQWPRLYQEFAAHAARNERFRAEFAARQRKLKDRMAAIYARWAASYGLEPPIAVAEIAAMSFFMADGFLLDRILDPSIGNDLYARMLEVFLNGLLFMAGHDAESLRAIPRAER